MRKLTQVQQRALREIRDNGQRVTFRSPGLLTNRQGVPPMTPDQALALERSIADVFEGWWSTWIEPQLNIIEGLDEDDTSGAEQAKARRSASFPKNAGYRWFNAIDGEVKA